MLSAALVVLVAVAASLAPGSAQDAAAPPHAKALAIRTKCMADLKVTDDDLKELTEQHEVKNDKTKQMTLCFFKATKIMDEKDKLSKAGAIEAAQTALSGSKDKEEKLKVASEIIDVCEKEVNGQQVAPAETAKLIYDCLKKNIIAKKLHEEWKV